MLTLIAHALAQDASEPQALVVELAVEVRNTIPLEVSHQGRPIVRAAAWVENGKAIIHPHIARNLRRTDAGKGNLFPHQVFALEDASILVIVTRTFPGQLRLGARATMSLRRTLPLFPKRNQAKKLTITPFGNEPALVSLVPWPELRWTFSKLAQSTQAKGTPMTELVLTAPGQILRLKPGQSHTLVKQTMTLPVVLMRFKPARIGETGPMEVQTIDLKTADFTAKTTIHFHGLLPLEVGK